MSSTKPSFVRRMFGGFWSFLDWTRRLLVNLIFLAIIVLILVAVFRGSGPKLEDKTLLVLNLNGPLVEQLSGTAGNLISRQFQGSENKQVQLRDVLSVLDAAAK